MPFSETRAIDFCRAACEFDGIFRSPLALEFAGPLAQFFRPGDFRLLVVVRRLRAIKVVGKVSQQLALFAVAEILFGFGLVGAAPG